MGTEAVSFDSLHPDKYEKTALSRLFVFVGVSKHTIVLASGIEQRSHVSTIQMSKQTSCVQRSYERSELEKAGRFPAPRLSVKGYETSK